MYGLKLRENTRILLYAKNALHNMRLIRNAQEYTRIY